MTEEINRIKRQKAAFEAKAQKTKMNDPLLSSYYFDNVRSMQKTIEFLERRGRKAKIQIIKQSLK